MATGWGVGTPASGTGTTLSTLEDICLYHGWHDTTATGLEALRRFINRTLQLLSTLMPWPEYHKIDGNITLATDTDSYVCATDGTTPITNISSVGIVLSSTKLQPLKAFTGGLDEYLTQKKIYSNTGQPTNYALQKYVSGGDSMMKMYLYPQPASGQNGDSVYFTYRLKPTELTELSDIVGWPDYRLWLLEEALEIRISAANRDTAGVSLQSPDFMANVHKAMNDSKVSYLPVRTISDMRKAKNISLRESVPYTGNDIFGDPL